MRFFSSRAGALIIAAVVVAGSTLANTYVKLGGEAKDIERQFYETRDGSKSIYTRLDERLDAVNGLWSLVVNYDVDTAASLSSARSGLLNAIQSRDISGMYTANQDLSTAFNAAAAVLNGQTLTDSEADALNDYTIDFSGAQKMIEQSDYNSLVYAFRDDYYDFPTFEFAQLVDVFVPPSFS